MRWAGATASTLALLALAARAHAQAAAPDAALPGFAPGPDAVVITLPGARAAERRAQASGDRVEIALVPPGAVAGERAVHDATVRRLVITGGARPVLAITLEHGRSTTARIAAATRVESADDGLRVTLPRKGALTGAAPERTAPAASASTAGTPAHDGAATPAEPAAAPSPEPVPREAPARGATAEPAAAAAGAPIAAPAPDTAPVPSFLDRAPAAAAGTTPAAAPSATRPVLISLLAGAAGLALLGAWRRKRRAQLGPGAGLEILGHRHLGGKSRVVLLRVRGRELLVGVAEQRLSLLDGWEESERESESNAAEGREPAEPDPIGAARAAGDRLRALLARGRRDQDDAGRAGATARTSSPLVSGILKLKQRRNPGLHPDNWSGSAEDDREWARALAEATEARGREARPT